MEKAFLFCRDLCHIRGMLSRKELGLKRSLKALYCGDNLFPLTGSFPYKISKFTLADIFLVQELLKRRLHRWARLIRRQPGLEGLETSMKRLQKSARGGFLPLFHFQISLMQRSTNGMRFKLRWPDCTRLVLLFMFISSWQCLPQGAIWLSFLAEAHKNLPVY